MTPHCADQDDGWLMRSMGIFGTNLDNWMNGKPLNNLIDKHFTHFGTKAKL